MFQYIKSSILMLAVGTYAVPTHRSIISITPGPGLPSLESLGLTIEQINDPNFISKRAIEGAAALPVVPRFDPICNNGLAADSIAGGQACVNYLYALGTTSCAITNYNGVFCVASDGSKVGGSAIPGSAASFCSDVAIGGQWVIDNCNEGNGYVEGSQAANGNGDLIVTLAADL
ncbi:hypothetical protein BX600DRAFT_518291 [Xylariales sp. PMI_506]|nr:hypothetical protein BX600DRAFT_518291 [Xylariales sp. PMI_506]